MPKKRQPTQSKTASSSLAKKFMSKEYMGIPTTMSDDELIDLDKLIDELEAKAMQNLENAPWRANEKPMDSVVIEESGCDSE